MRRCLLAPAPGRKEKKPPVRLPLPPHRRRDGRQMEEKLGLTLVVVAIALVALAIYAMAGGM
jgi:hypothetical protein